MTAPLVGQSVKRKEDQRFITGHGKYTDDFSRPGQTYAVFVRSPHPHARIKGIDAKAALATPGVLAVLTGEDLKADGVQGLICGWLIHSKDGSPMKAGNHPAQPARPCADGRDRRDRGATCARGGRRL